MHLKENNKPPRNGARNLVRMRRLKKKIGGPGDGTSGSVAKALYLDDAPWDLGPEVAFNYLASRTGIERKKCRPLDHVWQIPFCMSEGIYIGKWNIVPFVMVQPCAQWYNKRNVRMSIFWTSPEKRYSFMIEASLRF